MAEPQKFQLPLDRLEARLIVKRIHEMPNGAPLLLGSRMRHDNSGEQS